MTIEFGIDQINIKQSGILRVPKTKLFKGNTSTLKIDRGHLLPNGIYNQNLDAAKATFTLTNVAPQDRL